MERRISCQSPCVTLVRKCALCAIITLAAFQISGCSEHNEVTTGTEKTTTTSPPGGPALGIAVPPLNLAADVKGYMRAVLAAPQPTDYQLPEDIRSQTEYDRAVAKVGEHFPEFDGLESNNLLIAVKNHPLRYQEMIREARGVRMMFSSEIESKPSN